MQNSLFPYQVVHFLCIYQLRYIDKIFRHIVLQHRMRDHNRRYGASRPHRFLLRFERHIANHAGKHDHLRDRFQVYVHIGSQKNQTDKHNAQKLQSALLRYMRSFLFQVFRLENYLSILSGIVHHFDISNYIHRLPVYDTRRSVRSVLQDNYIQDADYLHPYRYHHLCKTFFRSHVALHCQFYYYYYQQQQQQQQHHNYPIQHFHNIDQRS
mmetsp:Transcript_1507/g.1745  ORF Transcript_1507/g.1745 Transcript_1507/m.1745 type:complete len:211 (-) Transcript_1507:1262-1894(-)